MTVQCPRCLSIHISTNHYGRKVVGTLGTAAGATSGYMAASAGARLGSDLGSTTGPTGKIAGAILGALIGGISGATAGTALGNVLDDNVLDKYRCLSCDFHFSAEHTAPFMLGHDLNQAP